MGLVVPSPKDKSKSYSYKREYKFYHLPIAPKKESHFIMPGAMFPIESNIGARRKETADEGPLVHAIYTTRVRETLDHDEAQEDVMCDGGRKQGTNIQR